MIDILHIPDTARMTAAQRRDWAKRWPHFSPTELHSRDRSLKVDTEALDALERVRVRMGRALHITSAYRNPDHNRRVGGRSNSRHLAGDAFDIYIPDFDMARKLEAIAIEEGFTGIGRYPDQLFIHIDHRPPKNGRSKFRWGKAWP